VTVVRFVVGSGRFGTSDHPASTVIIARMILEDTPNHALTLVRLGHALTELANYAEAEAMHRVATQCSDGCIDEAYHYLGLVLRGQGRLNESRECFEKAVELDPEYIEAEEALDDVNAAVSYRTRFNA
jgi:tetratricopeptide (TPR) repeat protein